MMENSKRSINYNVCVCVQVKMAVAVENPFIFMKLQAAFFSRPFSSAHISRTPFSVSLARTKHTLKINLLITAWQATYNSFNIVCVSLCVCVWINYSLF